MAIKRKKVPGLLEGVSKSKKQKILQRIENKDYSDTIQSVNKAIKKIELDKRNSVPDDGIMRIRYDAFRK